MKLERQAEIMELQQEIAFDKDESMIGRVAACDDRGQGGGRECLCGANLPRCAECGRLSVPVNTAGELMTGDYCTARSSDRSVWNMI